MYGVRNFAELADKGTVKASALQIKYPNIDPQDYALWRYLRHPEALSRLRYSKVFCCREGDRRRAKRWRKPVNRPKGNGPAQ
jgi:hypothetical protein